jgi:hypothetical protein
VYFCYEAQMWRTIQPTTSRDKHDNILELFLYYSVFKLIVITFILLSQLYAELFAMSYCIILSTL